MNIDLHQGDCLKVLKSIPDNSVDMVLTDPPYNILNFKWDRKLDFKIIFDELFRVLKNKNKVIALFGIEPFSSTLRTLTNHYKYDWYWQKDNVAGFVNAKKRPLKIIENICIFSQNPPIYYPQGLVRTNKKKMQRRRETLKNRRGGVMALYIVAIMLTENMCRNLPIIQSIYCNLAI